MPPHNIIELLPNIVFPFRFDCEFRAWNTKKQTLDKQHGRKQEPSRKTFGHKMHTVQ